MAIDVNSHMNIVEAERGEWDQPYSVVVTYVGMEEVIQAGSPSTSKNCQYIYFYNPDNGSYFIRKTDGPLGSLGLMSSFGTTEAGFTDQMVYSVGGSSFLYCSNPVSKKYTVYSLRDYGRVGDIVQGGSRTFGSVQCTYRVASELFFCQYNVSNSDLVVRKVSEHGHIDETVISVKVAPHNVSVMRAIQTGSGTYLYIHDDKTRKFSCLQIMKDGTIGGVTDTAVWNEGNFPSAIFTYNQLGDEYLLLQDSQLTKVQVRKLDKSGSMEGQAIFSNGTITDPIIYVYSNLSGVIIIQTLKLDTSAKKNNWRTLYVYGATNPMASQKSATVNIWPFLGTDVAWGHVSLTLGNGTYISWWPQGRDRKSMPLVPRVYSVSAIANRTLEDDIRGEYGEKPTITVTIPYGLNIDAIQKWWDDFSQNPNSKWATLSQNCSTTVKDALVAGGAWDVLGGRAFDNWDDVFVWSPTDVARFASAIRDKAPAS
ncbi:hypothetical protein HZF02_15280 [Pseudomonas yamanorum]|nr:hypothetical protein HZF02_15280 [Pseudomonas yamanorum]